MRAANVCFFFIFIHWASGSDSFHIVTQKPNEKVTVVIFFDVTHRRKNVIDEIYKMKKKTSVFGQKYMNL